ncbi:hypothetical protein PAMA_013790 [Pampus argenteus]
MEGRLSSPCFQLAEHTGKDNIIEDAQLSRRHHERDLMMDDSGTESSVRGMFACRTRNSSTSGAGPALWSEFEDAAQAKRSPLTSVEMPVNCECTARWESATLGLLGPGVRRFSVKVFPH